MQYVLPVLYMIPGVELNTEKIKRPKGDSLGGIAESDLFAGKRLMRASYAATIWCNR
jgi:hypothetical protein